MTVDYNKQAAKWHRDAPKHHSDFCGRPEVIELCKRLGSGKTVLDLGCGEGYFTRQIAAIARRVVGVDLSEKMLQLALEKENEKNRGIVYRRGDVRGMPFLADATFDLAVGTYITNYLKPEELPPFYRELARVTNDDGRFALLMPHPVLELIKDYGEAIQYRSDGIYDYIRSRGNWFTATLGTAQGDTLTAGLYHTTLGDHVAGLASAGLKVIELHEPVFPKSVAEAYPIFKKIAGKVGCMILVGGK